ncbi:MAG: imidazole glycerol phosphate synthase subunit HisH [Planctomycetes bacterium]|nr:imidazole glycerol phosphate synthase subunit HisH [Planctomycetota bacterium]
MMMIAIVDYGMGNLRSVQKGLEKVGSSARIVRDGADVRAADKLILPGVGAFGDAMKHLKERGLIEPVVEFARSGRPFLGVCLGLQLLFDVSYEEGEFPGLGLIPGKVVRFDFRNLCRPGEPGSPPPGGSGEPSPPPPRGSLNPQALKVPHMGWNQVRWDKPCPLLKDLPSGTHFYFVHSYYVVPDDDAVTVGRCDYGYPFTAAIQRGNVFATQFHPEKSQAAGLTILRNFAAR